MFYKDCFKVPASNLILNKINRRVCETNKRFLSIIFEDVFKCEGFIIKHNCVKLSYQTDNNDKISFVPQLCQSIVIIEDSAFVVLFIFKSIFANTIANTMQLEAFHPHSNRFNYDVNRL